MVARPEKNKKCTIACTCISHFQNFNTQTKSYIFYHSPMLDIEDILHVCVIYEYLLLLLILTFSILDYMAISMLEC